MAVDPAVFWYFFFSSLFWRAFPSPAYFCFFDIVEYYSNQRIIKMLPNSPLLSDLLNGWQSHHYQLIPYNPSMLHLLNIQTTIMCDQHHVLFVTSRVRGSITWSGFRGSSAWRLSSRSSDGPRRLLPPPVDLLAVLFSLAPLPAPSTLPIYMLTPPPSLLLSHGRETLSFGSSCR